MVKRLTDKELNTVLVDYLANLKTKINIDKAILYGSYAKGTAHDYSDIDLLIISKELSERKPKGACGLVLDRLVGFDKVHTDLEVIGVHPNKLNHEVTKSFFDEVLATGREIVVN